MALVKISALPAAGALVGTEETPIVQSATTVKATLQDIADIAIDAVVGGAPVSLDTLDKLANSIGDDPAFAATVSTALAFKAPLASPALTGTPTAPTQTAGDNSTKLATTAYVDARTISNDPTYSARGDIPIGTADNVSAMLAIGDNGKVLTADSTQATGAKWADPPGYNSAVVTALSISSGVVNINCALGSYFTLALDANVTSITFSNIPTSGASIMVRFTQDSTPRTVAWPASFKWAGGTAGSVSTGSGALDVLAITTFNAGTAWNATLAKGFA